MLVASSAAVDGSVIWPRLGVVAFRALPSSSDRSGWGISGSESISRMITDLRGPVDLMGMVFGSVLAFSLGLTVSVTGDGIARSLVSDMGSGGRRIIAAFPCATGRVVRINMAGGRSSNSSTWKRQNRNNIKSGDDRRDACGVMGDAGTYTIDRARHTRAYAAHVPPSLATPIA